MVKQYEGNFSDYKAATYPQEEANLGDTINNTSSNNTQAVDKKAAMKPTDKKLKFTYNEQREFDTIDEVIASLEETIEELDSKIAASASEYDKLHQLLAQKAEVEKEYEEKMERWVYLHEMHEKIMAQ